MGLRVAVIFWMTTVLCGCASLPEPDSPQIQIMDWEVVEYQCKWYQYGDKACDDAIDPISRVKVTIKSATDFLSLSEYWQIVPHILIVGNSGEVLRELGGGLYLEGVVWDEKSSYSSQNRDVSFFPIGGVVDFDGYVYSVIFPLSGPSTNAFSDDAYSIESGDYSIGLEVNLSKLPSLIKSNSLWIKISDSQIVETR